MRRTSILAVLLALGVSAVGQSQEVRVRQSPGAVIATSVFSGRSSGKLGLAVASGSVRDTLGLLVTSITSDGPAETAGIIEGDRLVSVNGVPLTLSAADAGEPDMSMILRRRLERELEKVEEDEEVTLRVWSAGRTREVKLRAAEGLQYVGSTGVYGSFLRRDASSRPVIGVSLQSTGSHRDTLGVFVTGVAPGGPAERAGIIEGHRIAAIDGVDLRVPAADVGDAMVASTRSSRLAREIEKLEPGATVRLRVWSDGRFRDVTVEVGRYEDVYKGDDAVMRIGGTGAAAFATPNVIIRTIPGMQPGRIEPLDSLWRRRDAIRRSVDPRLGGDSSGSGGVYDLRIDDQLRREIERSLQGLRQLQVVPSRGRIITTRM
jgi:predicted metalloprotease with PDZ domain